MRHSCGVIRCGSTAGILVPMRTNSTCGIARRWLRIQSSRSSLKASGSPPEMSTSRIVGRLPDVLERHLQPLFVGHDFAVAHDPRPRAVAAVGRAEIVHQQQDPVRIAMDQAGHRAVAVFAQRIVGLARCPLELRRGRNHRPAQRLLRIGPRKQAHVVGRDADREHGAAFDQGLSLVRRQDQHPLQLLQRADPVPRLPPPVVPLTVRNLGIECLAKGASVPG